MSTRIQIRLGDRVRRAREKAGFSQYQLAQSTGLRPETISRIESSHNAARVDTLGRIAKELDVTIDWLLGSVTKSVTKSNKGKKK